MTAFFLRVRLDPAPDERARLAAYPADDLWPDFAVITSGAIAIDIGGRAIAYTAGRPVSRPAGATDPAVWLPDYLGGLLGRLATAAVSLQPGQTAEAHLLDAPARLIFSELGDTVLVAYEDGDTLTYRASVSRSAFRDAVAAALASFLDDLLTINPRLSAHPEVIALQARHETLATYDDAPGFARSMRAIHATAWARIFDHPFVTGLGDGSLPTERYRFYLAQDYAFLIDYARLFSLAAAKAHDVDTMARLAGMVHATLTSEMALHRETSAAAGLTPTELEATRPTPTTYAYTRFLLNTAERGTLGETIAAILPCQCGYGEIALRLAALPGASASPYIGWIDSYAGEEFQTLAAWLASLTDRLYVVAGPDEQARMADAYALGLQYEAAFWGMALSGESWPLG